MLKGLTFLLFLFTTGHFSVLAHTEINGEYGFDRTKYGENRQNKIIAEHIRLSTAFYLFRYTAFELNYARSKTVTTEEKVITVDNMYDVTGTRNQVFVYSVGLGIRQTLAPRRARFRPGISMGYAQRFIQSTTTIVLKDKNAGNTLEIGRPSAKQRYDSIFFTFALNYYFTRSLALRGSVNTVFEAFKFDRAQDNTKYMAGLTWAF